MMGNVPGRAEGDGEGLPSGTVTFLLTDVEGSTRLWERAPDRAEVVVPRHREIIGAAVEAHGGRRPLEQGEGDNVVAAFARATDAVRAAHGDGVRPHPRCRLSGAGSRRTRQAASRCATVPGSQLGVDRHVPKVSGRRQPDRRPPRSPTVKGLHHFGGRSSKRPSAQRLSRSTDFSPATGTVMPAMTSRN